MVGILDTGVQANNEALINRITGFTDYVDPTNTTPQDTNGHGTVIAEIIGGTANADGSGGSYNYGGVAPQSSLYVARVGDGSGNINLNLVPQALSDLTAQGVKLINNSYGSSTPITSVTATDPLVAQDYATFASTPLNGQLMVWAAGNNGNAQPSVEAGLPYYKTNLQQSWLAVVNLELDPATGQVVGLDPTSNACGVAASWCLAAPGFQYFTPVAGTVFSTGAADGTSGSAAVVTGVAALVWQRFPYFSASQIQETLLTTATSLGDPALYGFGLVNAAKAVNGPGAFNEGAFIVNMPTGTTGVFSNDISGSGSLTLGGVNMGALVLTGNDTYTGGTQVGSGTLTVTGSLASDVSVMGSGVLVGGLDGSGTINGNVISSGYVSTEYGALKINGNYTIQPEVGNMGLPVDETDIEVGNPLRVSGTATLNNSPLYALIPNTYTASDKEPLLYAGVISGTFGSLGIGMLGNNDPIYYTGTLSYTPTEVDVTLTRMSVSSVAESAMPDVATTQQTARHIEGALKQADQWATSSSVEHGSFLNAASEFLRVSSVAEATTSINSLSGQLLASSQGLTFAQAGIVNRTVADRLSDLGGSASTQGAWFQGTGASGDIARNGYATGSYTGGGAVVGYDTALSDSFTLGAALDWSRLGSTYDMQAGTSSSRSTGAMLYGKLAANNLYLSGRVGQDGISSLVNRWAILGATPAEITSARHDRMDSAYLEAGYDTRSNAWVTSPFVSLGDEYLSRGTIAEDGAGGFGLSARSEGFNQSYAQIGGRLAYHWAWNSGQMWLKGFALYQRVLSGSDLGFTAAYAGAPDATFQLEGVNSPRNTGWIGVGLNALLDSHWSWFANLDGQIAGGGTKARVLSAGARYTF